MKKHIIIGCWNAYEELNKDGFMFTHESKLGDGLMKPSRELFLTCAEKGIHLLTLDQINDFNSVEMFFFFDMPDLSHPLVDRAMEANKTNVLFLNENPAIMPIDYDTRYHDIFQRIYTWHDGIVDGKKYRKLHQAVELPGKVSQEPGRKLCTMISSYKLMNHPTDLYHKRVQMVHWFEENHPEDFDLYGFGWPKDLYPSYQGEVDKKIDTLKGYKFAICYENNSGYPGYITEKIFDCFKAGVIPVYWGAPNIDSYIPKGCYIDMRDPCMGDYNKLYSVMVNMDDEDIQIMINNINAFLASKQAAPFKMHNWIDWMMGEIKNLRGERMVYTLPTEEPLVTVAIPSYNNGQYIKQTIDSVINQNYGNWELYILDNASPDNTREVLKEYEGRQNIYIIYRDENKGAVINWNDSLKVGSGKYIKMLHSDDYLHPDYLGQMVSILEAHPQCGLAYCPCIWDNGEKQEVMNHPGHAEFNYAGGRNETADLLIHDLYLTLSAVLFRRDALRKVGDFTFSDWEFFVRFSNIEPHFAFIKEPTAYYRIHGQQDSNRYYNSPEALINHIETVQAVLSSRYAGKLIGHEARIWEHLQRRWKQYPEFAEMHSYEIDTIGQRLQAMNARNA